MRFFETNLTQTRRPYSTLDVEVAAGKLHSSRLPGYVSTPHRIIEAARDFPHCTAVGVDLVPMPDM
jgi:hypothetical protein